MATAKADLRGIARMRRTLPTMPLDRIRDGLGRGALPQRVLT